MAGAEFKAEVLVAYEAVKKFDSVGGICGVSFPELAQHQPTLIQTLIKNDLIK